MNSNMHMHIIAQYASRSFLGMTGWVGGWWGCVTGGRLIWLASWCGWSVDVCPAHMTIVSWLMFVRCMAVASWLIIATGCHSGQWSVESLGNLCQPVQLF